MNCHLHADSCKCYQSHYFSAMQELLGAENLFILFALIALISLAFVVIYVPETKGLTLEEIETKILK